LLILFSLPFYTIYREITYIEEFDRLAENTAPTYQIGIIRAFLPFLLIELIGCGCSGSFAYGEAAFLGRAAGVGRVSKDPLLIRLLLARLARVHIDRFPGYDHS
jgi:hypothetical protein